MSPRLELMRMHQVGSLERAEDGVMILRRQRVSESTPEILGARWTHATDLLAFEARRLAERGLTSFQRHRTVRRIQALERVARRAMHDYRVALERDAS